MNFFIILLLTFITANAASDTAPWIEDYGVHETDELDSSADEDYRWLFEKVFPPDIRIPFPNESFKSFRVHLKDTYLFFPDPQEIESKNLKLVQQIKGKITYAGIVKKTYIYDVLKAPSGEIFLNVRIHLLDATNEDQKDFQSKIQIAQDIWNQSLIPTNFKYSFKFELVSSPSKAHFSVQVLDSTRGPYDTYWGRDWSATVVAHEIGHMMGLGDEYNTISGKTDCYRPSLMCMSWTGSPMEHHYYFILRRLIEP